MMRDDHLDKLCEIRALSYEAEQLSAIDDERARTMGAMAIGLREACHHEADPAVFESPVTATQLDILREYVVVEMAETRRERAVQAAAARRPYVIEGHETFVELVDGAASHAYLTLARESVSQTSLRRYPGSCSTMTYILQQELRRRGAETQHMWWTNTLNNHHFLRAMMANGDMIVIDPTWQQYLPEGTDYTRYPDVFIASTDHTTDALDALDMPANLHFRWLDAKVNARRDTAPDWDHSLTDVFEREPWVAPLPLHAQRFTATV